MSEKRKAVMESLITLGDLQEYVNQKIAVHGQDALVVFQFGEDTVKDYSIQPQVFQIPKDTVDEQYEFASEWWDSEDVDSTFEAVVFEIE